MDIIAWQVDGVVPVEPVYVDLYTKHNKVRAVFYVKICTTVNIINISFLFIFTLSNVIQTMLQKERNILQP